MHTPTSLCGVTMEVFMKVHEGENYPRVRAIKVLWARIRAVGTQVPHRCTACSKTECSPPFILSSPARCPVNSSSSTAGNQTGQSNHPLAPHALLSMLHARGTLALRRGRDDSCGKRTKKESPTLVGSPRFDLLVGSRLSACSVHVFYPPDHDGVRSDADTKSTLRTT